MGDVVSSRSLLREGRGTGMALGTSRSESASMRERCAGVSVLCSVCGAVSRSDNLAMWYVLHRVYVRNDLRGKLKDSPARKSAIMFPSKVSWPGTQPHSTPS